MSFVPVATLDQIPVGGCHALRVGRCPLVLFRPSAHEVYAAENRCPHEGYPLSTGRVADGKLTCEWHNWKFRLSDGTNEGGGEDLRTFPLEVHGQEVRVDLREPDAGAVWHAQTRGLEKAFEAKHFKQLFDVYVSVKLQGPSYVKGSRNPDEVRVDRLMLLKVDKDVPPLSK